MILPGHIETMPVPIRSKSVFLEVDGKRFEVACIAFRWGSGDEFGPTAIECRATVAWLEVKP